MDSIDEEDTYTIKSNTIVVLTKDKIELSDDLKEKIGIWVNKPITKRSAAIAAIIRRAYSILGKQPDKKAIESLGDFIVYKDRDDLSCILYDSLWALTDDKHYSKKLSIWEKPLEWIQSGDDIDKRLDYLYIEMSWFVYAQTDEWQKAKSTGCSASKFKWLKSCKFDIYKVKNTIKTLSLRNSGIYDNFQTLIKLGALWV
jgi:hypothetical protein